jgi:hypothetical protein
MSSSSQLLADIAPSPTDNSSLIVGVVLGLVVAIAIAVLIIFLVRRGRRANGVSTAIPTYQQPPPSQQQPPPQPPRPEEAPPSGPSQ